MRSLVALVSGALFGLGLYLSGMKDRQKVLGFLDFFGAWDATLMFVMGGAIRPMALAGRVAPLAGGRFRSRHPARGTSRSCQEPCFSASAGDWWGSAPDRLLRL